jgi:uroporphyrinogen decarboxylase
MNSRERVKAILNYEEYDRLPVLHFGFWPDTLQKWYKQGHLTLEESDKDWGDSTPIDKSIGDKLGFDFNWYNTFSPDTNIRPPFKKKVLCTRPDGTREVMNCCGNIELEKDGAGSIPAEIDHLLKDRQSWEEHFLPRLQFIEDRVYKSSVSTGREIGPFLDGGLEYLKDEQRKENVGLFCGSLFGNIRNWLGVEGLSYLYVDDEKLFDEIIDTVSELSFKCVEKKVGPHYNRISALLHKYSIDIVSLDCDGLIDALIPTWLNNGVNTMFPIEVGTWDASIKPWRTKYGRQLRGVGGMNKNIFSMDYAAIDVEIERLKPLIELGGYIPCPDHRIPPDAKWENVQYYCERMKNEFC